eukprot:m.26776 g.26776  ORF g.26776 m.26776 type:complete len:224 (+) comp11710_c0_seq1:247-918(+)
MGVHASKSSQKSPKKATTTFDAINVLSLEDGYFGNVTEVYQTAMTSDVNSLLKNWQSSEGTRPAHLGRNLVARTYGRGGSARYFYALRNAAATIVITPDLRQATEVLTNIASQLDGQAMLVLLNSSTPPTAAQTETFNLELSTLTDRYLGCLTDASVDDAMNWLTRVFAARKQAKEAAAKQVEADKLSAIKAKRLSEEHANLHISIVHKAAHEGQGDRVSVAA